jgi:hypothetical protein
MVNTSARRQTEAMDNVERVSVAARWDWPGYCYYQPKLILHLRHRMRPDRRTRHIWASDWIYSGGRVRGDESTAPAVGRKKRVRNELSSFYRGPIE